jgi:Mg-chelatase subunit ChlD
MILLTDGHANVPSRSGDAWADALGAMSVVTCALVVVDSEAGPNPTGRGRQLAELVGGVHVRLDEVNEMSALRLVREQ